MAFMDKIPISEELFDFDRTIAARLLCETRYGHRAVMGLHEFIIGYIRANGEKMIEIADGVFSEGNASISPLATVKGPTVIGRDAEIRPGAFIRGNAIIGRGAVIGNSTEIKNAIIFDEAKLPHYSYAGDSIIGYRAHFGAGAIASNQRLDKRSILQRSGKEIIDTGMKKLGALVGDRAEIGCQSVLSPGAIIGRGAMVYPLSHFRGCLAEGDRYTGEEKEEKRK